MREAQTNRSSGLAVSKRRLRARDVLIISILMFVRKKTQLGIAYGLLTLSAFAVIARDAHVRSAPPLVAMETGRMIFSESGPPLAITPLVESPFPKARPNRMDASTMTLARDESIPQAKQKNQAAPSGVYFLTVAVRVNSGDGPVAFHRGTRVRFVREQDGKFLVRRNGTDFLIEKSQVTDDLNALATLARNSS